MSRVAALRTLKMVRQTYNRHDKEKCVPNDIRTIVANQATNPCSITVNDLRDDYFALIGRKDWESAVSEAGKTQDENTFLDCLATRLVVSSGSDSKSFFIVRT